MHVPHPITKNLISEKQLHFILFKLDKKFGDQSKEKHKALKESFKVPSLWQLHKTQVDAIIKKLESLPDYVDPDERDQIPMVEQVKDAFGDDVVEENNGEASSPLGDHKA